jgi:2-polyprenyl-3-methyl-5-hydroxy-6-metoxy-1,4-benzoquinol methylase
VKLDSRYTQADHAFRDVDPYAKAKYDLTLRWLRDAIGPGTLLYNVGCGSGYFNALAMQAGARVVACEPDPEAYRIALQRGAALRRAGGDAVVDVVNCGLEAFARDCEPADVVVMHDVLEHVEDDSGAIEALARLVRPKGVVVVSVPALQLLFGLHDELLGHYRRYSASSLRRVVQARFRVERLQWFGMLSIPLVLWFSRWRRKPYPLQTGSTGALGRLYARLCAAETHVPEPIGSSILLLARPIEVTS